MSAASDRAVLVEEGIPKVSVAEIPSREVDGEEIPGLDPFVAYEHAYRRKKKGEDVEYEVTDNGGIRILYGEGNAELERGQERWAFSITVEVLDQQDDNKDSYVEVRYRPKIENHNDGEQIWQNIVDRLEEKTEEYHSEIKGSWYD